MVRPLKPALASADGTAVSHICAPDAFGAERLDLLQLGLSSWPPETTTEPGAAVMVVPLSAAPSSIVALRKWVPGCSTIERGAPGWLAARAAAARHGH